MRIQNYRLEEKEIQEEQQNVNIDSFFKLTLYTAVKNEEQRRYPTFRVSEEMSAYFSTKQAAEDTMMYLSKWEHDKAYCWVIRELPLGMTFHKGESFSECVYLPNGQLWAERPYADIMPLNIPRQYSEIEFDNYIYGRRFFSGRKTEEIKFKPGDIIEIFGYEGNNHWDDEYVELAIVLDTPATVDEIRTRSEQYLKTGTMLTGDRGFDLGAEFNERDDVYKVVPAYESIDSNDLAVDYCPTHCAMMPTMEKVSVRMRNKLYRLRDKVLNDNHRKNKATH